MSARIVDDDKLTSLSDHNAIVAALNQAWAQPRPSISVSL
jgi:hypothetical protein